MKKLICCLTVIGVLFGMSSCQDQHRAKNYNDKTLADDAAIHFIKDGIEGGMIEIRAAEIAKNRSSNQKVIGFADMMIKDHTQIGLELKKIQADKLVDSRDKISSEHQNVLDGLSAKSGAEFDKAYMEMMVEDHEKDIELFKSVSNNTSATIQDFSAKTLPTLQTHLDSAKEINASLK